MKRLLLLAILLAAPTVHAFPEMIRYGYGTCTACHISPNGGGVLSKYGRTISREALSHWTWEGDEQFAYGAVKLPEWLDLQGEFRSLEMIRTKATTNKARFIVMQADLEAAVKYEKFGAVASFGYSDDYGPQKFTDGLLSRRHWISYAPTDEITVRAGRFQPAIGINTPDHIISTRRGIGSITGGGLDFDDRQETYNVEASYSKDPYDVFVTGILGRPDRSTDLREKGGAIRGGYYFNERFKIGASYYYGTRSAGHSHVVGPYAYLGFTKQLYALIELDYINTGNSAIGTGTSGFVDYARLGYEFIQGFHVFGQHEWLQSDLSTSNTRSNVYSAGLTMYPLTHTEFQAVYQKRTRTTGADDDWVYFLFHYYL